MKGSKGPRLGTNTRGLGRGGAPERERRIAAVLRTGHKSPRATYAEPEKHAENVISPH